MDNSVKAIVKQVTEAQISDAQGNFKAAYIQYLKSTQDITQTLLANSLKPPGVCCDATTKKLVGLAAMCIQRTEDLLVNKIGRSHIPTSHAVPSQSFPAPSSTTASVQNEGVSSKTGSVVSPGYTPDKPFLLTSPTSMSPMEQAERQNQQLMTAYRARMSGLKHHKATEMSLSLQRRMAENLALGKAREQTLAKKRMERRIRLEAQAAKRFSATLGMSADELERRHIYTKILEYEQDNKWLLPWRERLKDNCEDCVLIQQLVQYILRSPNHPLIQLLCSYQQKIYDKIQPLLQQWQNARQKSSEATAQALSEGYPQTNSPEKSPISTQTTVNSSTAHTYDVSNFDELFENGPDSDHETNDHSELTDHETNDHSEHTNSGKCTKITDSTTESADSSAIVISGESLSDTEQSKNTIDTSPNNNSEDVNSQNLSDTPSSVEELEREAILRHVVNISRDIQDHLEKLVSMFIVAYDSLDHATGRDCCYGSLEEHFYKPIWGHIVALFRVVNHKEELHLKCVMTRHQLSSPQDLHIHRKFCLLPEDSLLMPEGYQPYQSAITELRTLTNMASPLSKLECIVQVSRAICKCVEEFYANNKTEAPNMGADDLLPLLSYVVIKSRLPQMLAECHALEELVHEGYLMGEEGYCLTSLDTAVRYVASMDIDSDSPSAANQA